MKIFAMVAVVLSMCVACGKNNDIPKPLKKQGFKQAENGILYKFEKENKSGRVAEQGEIIFGSIVMRFNDSIINKAESQPISQAMPSSGERFNVADNVNALHEGDVVTFAIMADTILALTGTPQALPPFFKEGNGDVLYYEIAVEKVMSQDEYAAYMEQIAEENRVKDAEALAKYISDNNVTVAPTANGVYVVVNEMGNGPKAVDGKTIRVNYTGRLLDGTVFDSSEGRAPFELTLGNHSVIAGWEEGLTGLPQGTKATLIIPQEQAYGSRSAGPIPPCSSLVFDVEIVDVR